MPVVQGGIDKPDGQLELAPVDVGWSALLPSVEMLSLDHIVNQDLDGLRLLGCQVSGMQVKPGESLKSTLFWKASQAGPPEHQGILWLEDRGGQRWAETTAPAGGGYPTSQWPAGQVVRDPRGLSLPSDMPDGPYALKLQVADASGKVYGPAVTLTTLKVQGRDKQFAMPRIGHPQRANLGSQVELLGYDLPSARVSPGGELSFTLYWRALSSMDTSFTVFNHLVGPDDGLAGQRDSVPVGGSLPTTQWVKGEIIADTYHLPVKTGASPGTYRLFTGLYNPATGDRLPVAGAEGSSPAADHVVLDTEIEVR